MKIIRIEMWISMMLFVVLFPTPVIATNQSIRTNDNVEIEYKTHIQDIGWENDWKIAGELSGTVGESKRLEALKVKLKGDYPVGAEIQTYAVNTRGRFYCALC